MASPSSPWLQHTWALFLEERERWLLWLPVFLGMGIAIYFVLPSEPDWRFGAIALLLLASLVALWPAGRLWLLPALFVSGGITIAALRTLSVAAPLVVESLGPLRLEGTLLAVDSGDSGTRLVLQDLMLEGVPPEQTPFKVRLRAGRAAADLLPGSRLSMTAELMPPPPPAEPGAFDFGRQAYFDQLGAVGFSYGLPSVVGQSEAQGWALWWSELRNTISKRVRAVLADDTGTVSDALITGERTAISEAMLQAYRDSGLAHLLSISGLHVSLIAGLIFLVVRGGLSLVPPIALRFPIKKWAAVVAGLTMPFYLFLVGASVPTQRSCLMVLLVLLAVLLDRRALSMRLIAWAAVVVLLVAPESLLSASFQMSFAAVTVLIAAYENYSQRAPRERGWTQRLWLYVAGVAVTSLLASAATTPFAVFHFNRIALYGVFANLVAVPLTAFWIMPLILLTYLLLPFGLEEIALVPLGWGVDVINSAAVFIASWPGAALLVPAMPLWGLLCVTVGGLWICLWSKRWRWGGALPLLVGLLSPVTATLPQLLISGDAKVIALSDDDGRLWLSTTRAGRFSSESWLRRRAQEDPQLWADAALGAQLRCDSLGCLYRYEEKVIALVFDRQAAEEDCGLADVVIATVPLPRACAAAVTLDRFDLWREGGHALTLTDEVTVETVFQSRGDRPWNPGRVQGADETPEDSD